MDHIQWDAVNIMRLLAIIITCVAAMEMVMMMSYYYWRLMPLRKAVGDGVVVAPPVVWTFAYHGFVTALLLVDAISKLQAILMGNKATVSTWLAPVVLIGLTVVTNRFQRYYAKTLSKAEWDHLRQ